MKVYIVEAGEYEGRVIFGVYMDDSQAMSACKGPWTLTYWAHHPLGTGYWREWECHCNKRCSFGITEHEVETSATPQFASTILEQRINEQRTWDYVPITPEEGNKLPTH